MAHLATPMFTATSMSCQGREASPLTVISLIFFVFSLIHFSRRIFSVALMSSLSFLISCVKSVGGQ